MARFSRFPVLALGNAAGDFVSPAASIVTASLARAVINENPRSPRFLQVNLVPVYASTDTANYPLSFVSYLIVPRMGTILPAHFTRAKGRTLSTYLVFALCGGQRQMPGFGYASLPVNLARGGLQQVANIPGHVRVPSRCGAATGTWALNMAGRRS